MGTMRSQITSLTIVYSTDYSDADQSKYQSSASLAFVRGIHRRPVNSPHKWPVMRKMFPFDDVIMIKLIHFSKRGFWSLTHVKWLYKNVNWQQPWQYFLRLVWLLLSFDIEHRHLLDYVKTVKWLSQFSTFGFINRCNLISNLTHLLNHGKTAKWYQLSQFVPIGLINRCNLIRMDCIM